MPRHLGSIGYLFCGSQTVHSSHVVVHTDMKAQPTVTYTTTCEGWSYDG